MLQLAWQGEALVLSEDGREADGDGLKVLGPSVFEYLAARGIE